MKKTG